MHVDRLKRIAAGTFKIAPGESDVGQGKIERKFVYLRQYLTAASSRLFWKQAKVSFDNPGCTWKLPPLRDSGHDNGQGPDAHRRERYAAMRWFHLHNEEIRGEDNNSRIRKAFRLVGHSAHTMNPMREAIFGAPGDESDNPDRKKIDKARKQKLDEVMEECEDEFRRISAMTVKVWANVTVATKSATSPAEHIKMLQEAIKEEAATADMRTRFLEYGQQDNSATMTYLEFLSLLVYTTRVMVKYFTYMLRMWVEHTNYMSSPTDMDKDLMRQIGRTVMALSNAQAIWYQLIRSPRTTAWALHLLQRPEWVISRTTAKSTGQDKAARYSIPDDDASADEGGGFDDGDEAAKTLDVPGIVEETIHNIDTTVVRRMMRSFFRLGAVTYQQRQAEKDIMPSFIQGSQNQFDIKFIPNMDEKHYGPGELRKFVKSYWEKLDARFSREPHWTGSKLLAELSSSQYFQDGNKELKLFTTSTARAHCESIIMVDWYEKHGKTKALPPIGISRAACGTCSILLYEVLHEAESGEFPNPERIVTGIGRAFWTCMLPTRTPIELKLSVLEYLERRIEVYLGEAEVIQEIRRHVAKSKAKPVEEEPKHESSVVSVGASSREASSPESSPASYSDVESQGRDDSDSF